MSACSCFPSENCCSANAVDLNWVDIVSENLALSLAVLKSQQLHSAIFLSESLNVSGWKGPQWVVWFSLAAQAGSS